MALDEALLESASQGGPPTLRIYRWSEPTLSLGYFQTYADRRLHPPSETCAVVRRQSGGGAILHDREWTYSFTASVHDRVSADVQALYRAIHGSLVRTLATLGALAQMWETTTRPAPTSEPFLCFQRRAEGDVVLDGHKICGSAQRRRKRAVLQHGSILLARSPRAPELPGIEDLTSADSLPEKLLSGWLEQLGADLGFRYIRGFPTPDEERWSKRITAEKHAVAEWISRK